MLMLLSTGILTVVAAVGSDDFPDAATDREEATIRSQSKTSHNFDLM